MIKLDVLLHVVQLLDMILHYKQLLEQTFKLF
jgi:hypothetical protein